MLSFDQLIQNLTDPTQPSVVRSSAIESIAAQGGSRGVRFLIEALTDSDSMVRREAAKALQNLGATEATEPLLQALQSESKDLTVWAMLEAIAELGNPTVLPTLETLSNADSMLTRIEVKKSIRRIRDRCGDGNTPELPSEEEITPTQTDGTQQPESIPSQETPVPDSDTVEAEETEERASNPLQYLINTRNPQISGDAQTTDTHTTDTHTTIEEPFQEQASVPTEAPSEPSVKPDPEMTTPSEDTAEAENASQSPEAAPDISNETELTEDVFTDPDLLEPEADRREFDAELREPDEDTESPDTKSAEPDEDREINDLVNTISRSPRLAGSSVALPVLAPNAATVPYHPNVSPAEGKKENFFLAVLHPGRYLSKRWVSRTRVYLLLWGILLAATIIFIQYHKHRGGEGTPRAHVGLSGTELPDLVERSLAEGDFYIQEGHYRKAISAYQLSRNFGVLPVHAYRRLGFAYFKEGQYALAVEAYEVFLKKREKIAPRAFTAEASLSGTYPTASIGEKVVQDYETYNILGTAYMKLGHLQDSQRAYERAIRLAPKYGEAYNNLARLYVDGYQQKLSLAETLAYTAVTLNPNVAAYHDTLGWILSKRGQVNRAIKTLERAIGLQSDAVEAHYHLAQVALKADERGKAVKSIRNVLKLDPAFVHLHQTAKKLSE